VSRLPAWPVHAIAAEARFQVVRDMTPLPGPVEARIDALWQVAQARTGGKLFNGRVFSADVITPHLVCGHWTEFRRIVAQMEDAALFRLIGARPLAVGGLIVGPDGVVFGRRPPRAVYQAGEWQLPPAGSVDPGALRAEGMVDVVGQLLTELQEEVGLPAAAVSAPRLLCIVEHGNSHVLDLGIALRTDLGGDAIRAAHHRDGNAEYDPLDIVPLDRLAEFVAAAGALMNHQAPVFLRRAGLLPA
jgi:hypothetical protein